MRKERGIRPSTLRRCNAFVQTNHSYLSGVRGCIFTAEAFDGDDVTAVIIIGRPISPQQDDGVTAEITRLCTSGAAPYATASALIKRARRACKAIGFERIISYCDSQAIAAAFKCSNFKKRRQQKRKGWHGRQLQQPSNATAFITLYELEI